MNVTREYLATSPHDVHQNGYMLKNNCRLLGIKLMVAHLRKYIYLTFTLWLRWDTIYIHFRVEINREKNKLTKH